MKRALQQAALAILFGLGIPGLILGVTAAAEKHTPELSETPGESTSWVETIESEAEGGE